MAGLWDGVPASPCSGASDDGRVRNPRATATSTVGKRTRFSSRTPQPTRPYSPDVAVVGFKDASMTDSNGNADLVSKLNVNAADERRKALLAKLRAIDEKKAALRRNSESPGAGQVVTSALDPKISSIFEAATPEPAEVEIVTEIPVVKHPPPPRQPVATRAPSARKKKKTPKAKPSLSLDVSSAQNIMDLDRFTASSPLPSPKAGSSAVSYADLPSRTRSSRRVSRPRTPSVLLNGMPGETVLSKLPVGVLKCKRYQFCKKLVSLIMKNSSAGPFCAPVAQLWPLDAIPRYFDVITKPMDLGTVKKNLDGTLYLNANETNPLFMLKVEDFAEDMRQVFRNAMVYNNKGDMLYNCAEDLLEEFEVMWKTCPEEPDRDANRRKRQSSSLRSGVPGKRGRIGDLTSSRYSGGSLMSPRRRSSKMELAKKLAKVVPKKTVASHVKLGSAEKSDKPLTMRQVRRRLEHYKKCRIAIRARTPLPKGATFYDRAALIHDVEMTYAEKNRMSEGIHRLPAAKLDTFLSIIRDGSEGEENRDEIELDIDGLDNKTLRNIEAFLEMVLPNYKTIRNSDSCTEFDSVKQFETDEKELQARLAEAKDSPAANETTESSPMSPMDRDSEELYASSDDDSDSSGSDSDSSGSDSDSE